MTGGGGGPAPPPPYPFPGDSLQDPRASSPSLRGPGAVWAPNDKGRDRRRSRAKEVRDGQLERDEASRRSDLEDVARDRPRGRGARGGDLDRRERGRRLRRHLLIA